MFPQVEFSVPVLAPVLARRHRRTFGRWPRLVRPQTFNEKVLHRMLFDRRPVLTRLCGTLEARSFVLERTGEPSLLPSLVGTATGAPDLRALHLPESYVVKANHLSGRLRFVDPEHPAGLDELGELVAGWCRERFHTEWGYRGARPVAIVEAHLSPGAGPPADHKFFCFDGQVPMVMVDADRFGEGHTRTFFDLDWRPLPVRIGPPPADPPPPPPAALARMAEVAAMLSEGLDFVRVDLYDVGGQVQFGELTVYPGAGDDRFFPAAYDVALGSHWRLPPRRDTYRVAATAGRPGATRRRVAGPAR